MKSGVLEFRRLKVKHEQGDVGLSLIEDGLICLVLVNKLLA